MSTRKTHPSKFPLKNNPAVVFKNRHIKDELQKAEERFRSIVETTQEGVWIINAEGRIIYVNKRMTEMLGYTAEEISGSLLFDFLDEKEQIYIQKNLDRRKRGIREGRIFKKGGSYLWVLESVSPLLDINGKLYGQLMMVTDITERKKMEEILKKVNDELESRINQRTAELVEKNEQLKQEMQERVEIEKRILLNNTMLKLLATASSYKKYLDSVVKFFHNITGCQCVGIRILDKDGQIPYESYMGFSQEFWESENRLSIYEDKCACIRVITGKLGPQDIKAASPGGSFYCNDTIGFVDELSEKEKAEFRGACVKNGFYSVAVIPVNYKNNIISAIHLADKKNGMVPLKTIELIESLTPLLGEGIYRFSLDLKRTQAEKKLRETNEILETTFSSTNLLIAYMDSGFNIIRVNKAYAQAHGQVQEFFIGKNYFDLHPDGDARLIFERVVEASEGYSTYTKSLAMKNRAGQEDTYWDWSVQPVKDSHGKATGIVFCLIDVTKRKNTEEELIVAQKKLIESKRLSDIGTLAAIVAHELRNPLGVIQIAAYNIAKKTNEPSIESHITNIEKKISESNQIINNLLSYSRIRVPHFEKINIIDILDECVNLAEKRFNKYEVSINRKFDFFEEGVIKADPFQIKEVFNNIINNAYQSLPDKKGVIEIYAGINGDSSITISFKDNGCGISKEDLPKVFDPFYTRKSKGTGLGLTICRELVNMHGGEIKIESEEGKGTNININIPVQ